MGYWRTIFATIVLATPGLVRADGESLAKPAAHQIAWADGEIGMFIHFGSATCQDGGDVANLLGKVAEIK